MESLRASFSPSFYRLLVEKIFAQYMVPHSLDTEEKMKCLYYLYACLDTNAVKSVNLQYGLLWGNKTKHILALYM